MKYICSVVFALFIYSCATAQEYEIRPLGSAKGMVLDLYIDPDDMGRAMGTVKSADGNAVDDAVIVVYDERKYYKAGSKNGGNYSVSPIFGVHFIEVRASGYETYVGEVDVPKGDVTRFDITLTPSADSDRAKVSIKDISCKSYSLTFKPDVKQPAYEGKSLLDVLRDTPSVGETDGGFSVTGCENVEFFVNGRPFKAPHATALKFFRSVDASKVRSINLVQQGSAASTINIFYNE